jgi:oligopeptide transport system substrate-binding protein
MQIRHALAVSVALPALAVTGGCSGDESDPSNAELRIAIHEDPGSLDPALAGEPSAGNVLVNLMDPLVRLNDDLEPEPALAEGWEESAGRTTVTFRLRDDGRWTNGDRVTALDFEYAWKRVLDPKLAAVNASQLYGIVGATLYNGCERDCEKLRERVGVKALDERTLEVKLTSPQPWFVGQVAHVPFLPVHRATVETFGRKWTDPGNIVTNGPYRLTGWTHDESITLTKWKQWRGADAVKVEQFAERIIKDATTALTAFEAGEIHACVVQACIPPDEIERLRDGDAYVRSPGLVTRFLGLNLMNVPDLNQRRALAFALDRTSLVENVTKADEEPATSLTPEGMPGFDAIEQHFLPKEADLEAARRYLEQATSPKRTLSLFYSTSDVPAEKIAVAVQAMWRRIGLRIELHGLEEEQYYELVGPPTDGLIDVFVWGTLADFGDDMSILETLTCRSGYNPNGYCDGRYDQLIERARSTPDEADRHQIYAQAEAMLTGSNGALPIIPTYWASLPTLRDPAVEGWHPNLFGRHDFTKVSVAGG